VDTEFSGYYTYFQEICLIQISSGPYHFVIDTLCDLDLSALGNIFANPSIIKIFHSASSDITEMRKQYSWNFRSIFDTMLACRMLGHTNCSLADLVKLLGVHLEKKEQKSNWKKRPLTKAQLDYAHLDTLYLESLMDLLSASLKEAGFMEEIEEEFERTCTAALPVEKPFNPDAWMETQGALNLTPVQRSILKKLHALRDARARKENIAAFRLITSEGLLRIAREKHTGVRSLTDSHLFNPVFISRDGERILQILESKDEIRDSELPPVTRFDFQGSPLFRSLKKWRQKTGEFRGFDHSLILSNKVLQAIADRKPETMEQLEEMNLMSQWKLKNYGPSLLEVLRGKNPPVAEHLPRLKKT